MSSPGTSARAARSIIPSANSILVLKTTSSGIRALALRSASSVYFSVRYSSKSIGACGGRRALSHCSIGAPLRASIRCARARGSWTSGRAAARRRPAQRGGRPPGAGARRRDAPRWCERLRSWPGRGQRWRARWLARNLSGARSRIVRAVYSSLPDWRPSGSKARPPPARAAAPNPQLTTRMSRSGDTIRSLDRVTGGARSYDAQGPLRSRAARYGAE